ncbi:MAG TPA: ATPase [Deltaproteobacteria bacterium]|nr:ATPase [Deltaproteobacteria bacterium]
MYEDFFGLIEKPFNITPDTHFLYSSPQHEEVVQTLFYGIQERKGFMLLTGEVGTGKTTCLRALLNRVDQEKVHTSLILNPLVSTVELIKSINKDFGLETSGLSVKEQLDVLNNYVLDVDKAAQSAVVIIDEAQNLSMEALEMTRLLSNLETETHKLLQIVLVGQPELEEKLADRALRQLAQRIQVFCHLIPMGGTETENYIQHRIQKAGNNPLIAFEHSAVKEIQKISNGIPRIINTICELALLAAYSSDTRVITKSLVREAAKEVPSYVHHS